MGPKDGSDYVGGNFVSAVNFSTTVPKILENIETVDVNLLLMLQIYGELIMIHH